MRFLKNLFWRLMPVEGGPATIGLGILVLVIMGGAVFLEGWWRVDQCEAPLQQAEAELAEAFRQTHAAGELRTQGDPSCPVYRNFLQVAERAETVFQRCRSRPVKRDMSTADIPGYVASIRTLVAERCGPP